MKIIVGFKAATISKEIENCIKSQGYVDVAIVEPDDFFKMPYSSRYSFIVGVTLDQALRQQIIDRLDQDDLPRFTAVHPKCEIDPTSVIKPGSYIGPFSMIAYQSIVGRDCLVGPYTLVGHRSTINDNCFIGPMAMIAGSVNMGSRCYTGIKTTIIDKITICNDVNFGAGSLVTKNITEPGKYVGSPARKVLT